MLPLEKERLTPGEIVMGFLSNPAVIVLLILIAAFAATGVLQANAHDNIIHRRASGNVLLLHRFPWDDPIEQAKTLFFHPLHTAILTAPFVLWGERWAGFFNTICILWVLIGRRTGWSMAATLLFAISPPIAFVIAASNMPGFTTGMGLIWLLAEKRGPMRAYSWAMFLCRPQDSVFLLAWDGMRALRTRDWTAFLLAGGLLIPSILTLTYWLSIIPKTGDQLQSNIQGYYSMSIAVNHGWITAILAIVGIILYRFHHIRWREGRLHLERRAWTTIPLTEKVWLFIVAWLMLSPYYLIYMLWMVLLPLRLYDLKRTILTWMVVFIVGWATMKTLNFDLLYQGGLMIVLLMTLLTPKMGIKDDTGGLQG